MNSENLRNHWSMNWVQYKDLLCYLSVCGLVVSSLSLTQEILGSSPTLPFLYFINFFCHWIQRIQWKHLEKTPMCFHGLSVEPPQLFIWWCESVVNLRHTVKTLVLCVSWINSPYFWIQTYFLIKSIVSYYSNVHAAVSIGFPPSKCPFKTSPITHFRWSTSFVTVNKNA